MRTVLVTIYDGDTEKIILHGGVVHALVARGVKVVLCIRGEDRRAYYTEHYAGEHVSVEVLPPSRTRAEMLWHEVSWNSVPVHFVYVRHRMALARTGNYLAYVARSTIWLLAHLKVWRAFLRFLYGAVKDNYAHELFEKYKPDLVFAPNMFSPSDFRILRAAKQRGIKTVTMGKSWDVFTTKAFTRVKADKIIAFNEHIKEEAIKYGDYKPRQIVVTGFPQYDASVSYRPSVSRDEFCKRLGLNPAKKIILFALQGDWIAPKTHEVLGELDRAVRTGVFGESAQILARFHPKYRDASEKLVLANGVFDRPGTLLGDSHAIVAAGGDLFSWTFSEKDIAHLFDTVYFADVAVLTVSTMFLDTLAMGKPTVLVGYDGNSKMPYWRSIARQYEREYYQHALSFGATPLARSHDELVKALKVFLENPDHLQREREAMKKCLLYKHDGTAAVRVADAIMESLQG